mgnify:CR=1 FL=1
MERRNFIKSSLGIGLGATLPGMTHSKSGKEAETAVSPAMPVKSGKPHIILIMTDQQRGDALGCMGNKAVISPEYRPAGARRLVVRERIFLRSK